MYDLHLHTASEVFGVPEDLVTPEQRKAAKALNFQALYGPPSGKTDLRAIMAMYQAYPWQRPVVDLRSDMPGGIIRLLATQLP